MGGAAGPKRRLAPELRRGQLLDAAVELAADGDLAAVSVADIAAHAGVSEGLLYHYFPTKAALLAAAVERAAEMMAAALAIVPAAEPRTELAAALTAYLDHVQADPHGWRALLRARNGALADLAAAGEQHSRQLTLTLLGVDRPSPVLAAVLAGWAALERQVCLDWLSEPAIPRAAIEDLLLGSFLSLLTAAAGHDDQARHALSVLDPGHRIPPHANPGTR